VPDDALVLVARNIRKPDLNDRIAGVVGPGLDWPVFPPSGTNHLKTRIGRTEAKVGKVIEIDQEPWLSKVARERLTP
jgi:hypothetical protein